MPLELFPTLNNSDSAVVHGGGMREKREYAGEKKAKHLADPKFLGELTNGGKQKRMHVY